MRPVESDGRIRALEKRGYELPSDREVTRMGSYAKKDRVACKPPSTRMMIAYSIVTRLKATHQPRDALSRVEPVLDNLASSLVTLVGEQR